MVRSGFLNGLGMVTKGSAAAVAAGIIMMFIGVVFASMAAAQMVILLKVGYPRGVFGSGGTACIN